MKKLFSVLLLLSIFQYSQAITIAVSHTNASCHSSCNGTASVIAGGGSGAYRYHWSTGATTGKIKNLCPGKYSVTVADARALRSTATASVAITQPTALVVNGIISGGNCSAACNGAISLTVSGGTTPYAYRWSTGATTQNIAGLCSGTYCVVVTDKNGCSTTSCFGLTQTVPPTVNMIFTSITCGGSCDGSTTAVPVGGTAPYTYTWSNGETKQSLNNLCAGNYCVTITTVNGCQVSACVAINQPSQLVVSTASTNTTCAGNCNGTASVTITGGTPPYTYRWANGATTGAIAGLCPGNYCVTVADSHGCFASGCVNITTPGILSDSITVVNGLCGNCNGGATAHVFGGTVPYRYNWSIGATTASVAGLCAGTYCVTTTDNHGCFTSSCATVSGSSCPVPAALRATRPTGTSTTLSWTIACPVSSYTVELKRAADIKWSSKTVTTTSISLTGLTRSTTYQARVRANCAGGSSAFTAAISFTTLAFRMEGNTQDNSSTFSVYPNPAQNELHIDLPYNTSGNSRTIKIANLLGQTVMTKIIAADVTSDEIQITDNIANGTYIITLSDGSESYNQHIVIAR